MLRRTRRWLYNRDLSKKLSIKKRDTHSGVNPAHHIGILYDATDLNNKQILSRLTKKLTANERTVKTLSYIHRNVDEIPTETHYYTKKHLNWLGIPQQEIVEQFISSEFDILITLFTEFNNHMEYIVKMSNAKLKIGPCFPTGESFFDLTIDVQPITLDNLISDIIKTMDNVGH